MRPLLTLAITLWWFWLLHLAYWFRSRNRLAAGAIAAFKFVMGKRQQPDTIVRDWLLLMWPAVVFIAAVVYLSAQIER
jgi:hypothetical protein